jgi:formylglycine-generating enzyme required for sulfatase activity
MSTYLRNLASITESILCPPFEWCHVQGGLVTIKDAAFCGGTRGGEFVATSFAIGKYPVTNNQYQRFLDDPNGYCCRAWWEYSPEAIHWHEDHRKVQPTAFDGPDFPRTRVSWFDCMAFCAWLSVKVNFRVQFEHGSDFDITDVQTWHVRLPTEQEWQRAALADTDWQYPFGNHLDDSCGNFGGTIGHPTRVGSYPGGKSPCGAMDMLGNVWEWCLTPWGLESLDTGGYTYRISRGGAWNVSNPEHLRANDRYGHPPRGRLNDAGFRCALHYL